MTIIDVVFALRVMALLMAGIIATKHKNYLATSICFLYIAVTTVNFVWGNPYINAVFSTPLVFLTAWFIIKCIKKGELNA